MEALFVEFTTKSRQAAFQLFVFFYFSISYISYMKKRLLYGRWNQNKLTCYNEKKINWTQTEKKLSLFGYLISSKLTGNRRTKTYLVWMDYFVSYFFTPLSSMTRISLVGLFLVSWSNSFRHDLSFNVLDSAFKSNCCSPGGPNYFLFFLNDLEDIIPS